MGKIYAAESPVFGNEKNFEKQAQFYKGSKKLHYRLSPLMDVVRNRPIEL